MSTPVQSSKFEIQVARDHALALSLARKFEGQDTGEEDDAGQVQERQKKELNKRSMTSESEAKMVCKLFKHDQNLADSPDINEPDSEPDNHPNLEDEHEGDLNEQTEPATNFDVSTDKFSSHSAKWWPSQE